MVIAHQLKFDDRRLVRENTSILGSIIRRVHLNGVYSVCVGQVLNWTVSERHTDEEDIKGRTTKCGSS